MSDSSGPHEFTFKVSDISCSRKTILGAMGYLKETEVPEPVAKALDEILTIADKLFSLRGGYMIRTDIGVDNKRKMLTSHGETFLTKQIVTHQLRNSEQLAWFLFTAGNRVTEYSKKLNQEGDSIKGYVTDIVANEMVEAAMDKIQDDLRISMNDKGLNITNRYSPGYCNWDIAEQRKLFKVFPEEFLDVKLSESCLMIPVKSISGVIGIGKEVKFNNYTCNMCDDINCYYRNKRHKSYD